MSTTPSAPLHVESLFDATTWTVSHLVMCTATRQCALVDSVLDYDPKSGRTGTRHAEQLLARVQALGAQVQWILETHVHADHLSAAPWLKARTGGRLGIGQHITTVQKVFGGLFNAEAGFARDGSQFDHLFADGEAFQIGQLQAQALHTPGHTPACMAYLVHPGDGKPSSAFVGDTLFMPDYGTARCDFPGGDARTLWRSIQRLLALPPATRLFMCHDYQPGGRELRFESTVAEQRAQNIHLQGGEDAFVAMRTARDATLDMPTLILPSVQVNMRAGHLPPAEDNGVRYLKIPLDAL
jgi:glyoxylase-like metal-dependent hydrolase (beta-lactamase superfamily II)